MFDVFFAIDALIVLGLLILVFMTLSGGGFKHRVNRLFTAFTVMAAVWIIANHISNDVSLSPSVSTIANYFIFSCSFGAMIFIMKLMALMVNDEKSVRIIRIFEPVLWLAFILAATPLTAKGVELQDDVYAVVFGPFIPMYGLLLIGMVVATYIILHRGVRTQTGKEREKLRVLTLSLSVALPLILTFSFILPSTTGIFALTEFGVTPILILIAGFYYTIIKHQLFDVRLAVVRTVAYALALLTLSGAYFLMAYFVSVIVFKDQVSSGVSASPVNIILALLLAFIFQPIKQFFDRATNNIFYRDQYSTSEFIARLGEELATTTDLRNLLERAAIEIGTTLKAEQAFFYVLLENGRHMSAGTEGHATFMRSAVEVIEDYVKKDKAKIVVTDTLADEHPVKLCLTDLKIALLQPLLHDGKPIGYLALGEQRSTAYTKRDLEVLDAISDELVIAVQNALSVQEVKNINAHLQQRIDEATSELRISNKKLHDLDRSKDEFISMASHQLRTPLTAVKGYLSMLLDGDIGSVTKEQRQVLEQAYDSSQRMVFLIGDFLNVSRIQTGKFMLEVSDINLADLIPEEIDQLVDTAKARQIEIKYEKSAGLPKITADENKLRQVMMNFMDNAIYYSRSNSVITIQLYKDADSVIFKVIDTGIGVPKSEQPHLFTKFYRASNARQQRPDGTGIGLYMAKKVIVAHGGSVIFETREGIGSTFGFKLPLKYDVKQLEKQPKSERATADHVAN